MDKYDGLFFVVFFVIGYNLFDPGIILSGVVGGISGVVGYGLNRLIFKMFPNIDKKISKFSKDFFKINDDENKKM